MEFVDQSCVHELIFVRNIETDHPLTLQRLGEFPLKLVHMRFLHAEDDVSPPNVTFGDDDARVWLCAH